MRLTFVVADNFHEFNTSRFLCKNPADSINNNTQHEAYLLPLEDFEKNTKESQEVCAKSDVIVVERNFRFDCLVSMMFWKTRGKVIVCTFDDSYDNIEDTNVSAGYWRGSVKTKDADGKEVMQYIFPKPLDQFKWGLQIAYAFHTPSEVLTKDWKKINPNGYYMPNLFETKYYIGKPLNQNKDIITLFWGGSLSHLQSFRDSGIIEAMESVCKERPNVRIMICGDDRLIPIINIPITQKLFQPFVPFEKWGETIAANATIGLAPLCGVYDQRRSHIKIVEYMMLKMPFIASRSLAYQKYTQYGKFVNNDYLSWKNAILYTIDNLDERRKFAEGLPFEFAKTTEINLHANDYIELYKKIAEKHAGIKLS